MKIEKFYGTFGAVIADIDIKVPFSNSDLNALKQAFVDHQVLIFHNQQIKPKHQLALS